MSDAKKITQKFVDLMTAIEPTEKPNAEKIAELEVAVDITLQLAAIVVPVLVRMIATECEKIKSGKYAE